MRSHASSILTTLGPLCAFLVGCDEEAKQTIIEGLQAGATTVVASLITALFQILSGMLST